MREFIREAVAHEVLRAKVDLKDTLTREAPKELNVDELERRVLAKIEPKVPVPQVFEKPKDGRDAVGIAGVTMRSGDLILRLSDGTEHNVGRVIGEKGDKGDRGENGKDSTVAGDKGEKGDTGERGVMGLSGTNGKDGSDGLPSIVPGSKGDKGERGADGIATREELESIIEELRADVQVRTFADVYQGVYENNKQYTRGLLTTWGGSLWLSQVGTRSKPGENGDWKLVAKRGSDGKK
jgi:hypothetical protein